MVGEQDTPATFSSYCPPISAPPLIDVLLPKVYESVSWGLVGPQMKTLRGGNGGKQEKHMTRSANPIDFVFWRDNDDNMGCFNLTHASVLCTT